MPKLGCFSRPLLIGERAQKALGDPRTSGVTWTRPTSIGRTNFGGGCVNCEEARIALSPKPEKRQSIGNEPDGDNLPAKGNSASRGLLISFQERVKAAPQRSFVEAADEVLIERREDYLAKRMVYVRRTALGRQLTVTQG